MDSYDHKEVEEIKPSDYDHLCLYQTREIIWGSPSAGWAVLVDGSEKAPWMVGFSIDQEDDEIQFDEWVPDLIRENIKNAIINYGS